MDDLAARPDRKPSLITLIAGGCLTVLYTALCVVTLTVGGSQIANLNGPTPTPTNTPVPRVLIQPSSDQTGIIHEDFSSDKNLWGLYYEFGKLEVINGKLVLQSDVPNAFLIGTSRKLAPDRDKYYIQADFSTDIETDEPYGLIFGSNRMLGTYYVFQIWPENGSYSLFKHNSGKWTELIPATGIELNPYPFSNTLSVSFDRGEIDLYINGEMAAEFTDEDFFQSKDIGMFLSNTGFRLLIDDLFIYSEE